MTYKKSIDAKDDFLTYLDVERNVSPHTYRSYQYDLNQFFTFWKELNNKYASSKKRQPFIFKEALEKFFLHLYQKKIKKSSISRKIACFKSFEKYLQASGVEINLQLTTPRIEKKLPTYLTVDEITYLLDGLQISDMHSKNALRDKTILETLYSTGIRCSELCNIKLTDIDFDQKTIVITGKGDKQRIVLFGEQAKQRLLQYIQKERIKHLKDNNEYLFITAQGSKIHDRSIQMILNKFRKHLPTRKAITPHTIRHSFATHLLNAGMNLRALQELLGHSSLATTEKYTHIASGDLKKLYQTINPLELNNKKKLSDS